jgi:hypothetical protein
VVKILGVLAAAATLVACNGPGQVLAVKQFQLRDQARNGEDEPMVRMEKERRLRGAVSMAERGQRLGQYYTVQWHDPIPANSVAAPVEVTFLYQQGATASRVKKMVRKFPANETAGKAEFSVIGDNYFKGGRVLAWQVILRRGGRGIASRQSYLWR